MHYPGFASHQGIEGGIYLQESVIGKPNNYIKYYIYRERRARKEMNLVMNGIIHRVHRPLYIVGQFPEQLVGQLKSVQVTSIVHKLDLS